jgi:hypothetical protein
MSNLAEQTMLIDFGFSTPKLTAVDRKQTSKTITETGAQRGVARVVKNLYSKDDIKMVTTFRDEVRSYHYRMTLPWMHNGPRILPSVLFMEYTERMRAYRTQWDVIVDAFCSNFAGRRDRAMTGLGTMGNESDYPATYEIAEKFELRINILPVPTAGDFRVDIGAEHLADMNASLQVAEDAAVAKAMEEVKSRLIEVVSKMATNLTKGSKVFDTIVTNVTDLCDVLPAFNLANDPRIESLRLEIIKTLGSVHPDSLRSDKALATKVGDDAQKIVDKMSAYFG